MLLFFLSLQLYFILSLPSKSIGQSSDCPSSSRPGVFAVPIANVSLQPPAAARGVALSIGNAPGHAGGGAQQMAFAISAYVREG